MMKFETSVNDQITELELDPESGDFSVNDTEGTYKFHTQANGRRLLRIGEKLYTIDNVSFDNRTVEFTLTGAGVPLMYAMSAIFYSMRWALKPPPKLAKAN